VSRLHLFEFEDLPWFPSFLRNYGTDFLQFVSNRAKIYKPIVSLLNSALQKDGNNQIIDLGSGGGGGLLWLSEQLKENNPALKIVLTDLYPNIAAFNYTKHISNNFEFIETPVDARDVPKELKGLRTQFLSLHHFKPKDARKILQNAIDSNSSIAIFEAQERSLPSILAMLISPLTVWITTPFIRPFKIGRIVFTYLIPLVPLFTIWDGVVSALRTYSIAEMNDLVNSLENKDRFDWNIGKMKSGLGVILYLIGTKKTN
jgi:hypothetical protein